MTIKQYILDALQKFWNRLQRSYITNCTTNNNNYALAASQGKILQDQINELNNIYIETTQPSTATTGDIWFIIEDDQDLTN